MNSLRVLIFGLLVSLATACGDGLGAVDVDGGETGGGSGGMTGGGGGSVPSNVTWCDVKPMLDAQCGSCHGANVMTPQPGAPTLATRAQLRAPSPAGGTMLDRSIIRMAQLPVSSAMPPGVGGAGADVALLEGWRSNAGADCAPDAGMTPFDAGVVTPICTSNLTWSLGNNGGLAMNPGEACISCHTSRNRGPRDGFMGTVYPTLHETPLCVVTNIPSGLAVQILDMSGAVRQTFSIGTFSNGNFRGGVPGMPSPYRARVVLNGVVKSEMLTAQTNGDCNSCHGTFGLNGAPGRLHW
ncbi:MAG: hypothetical protein JNM17_38610 [Archangium sp.]|nr:hypothetical protein [Archangium sp.]